MSFRVFISHSVNQNDYPLVQSISNLMWANGMEVFIPEWHPSYRKDVSGQVAAQIDSSNVVLALVTSPTSRLTKVAREVNYALGKGKELMVLAEDKVNVEDIMLSGSMPIAYFNRNNFTEIASTVAGKFEEKATKDANRDALVSLLAAGLILWALSQKGGDSSR